MDEVNMNDVRDACDELYYEVHQPRYFHRPINVFNVIAPIINADRSSGRISLYLLVSEPSTPRACSTCSNTWAVTQVRRVLNPVDRQLGVLAEVPWSVCGLACGLAPCGTLGTHHGHGRANSISATLYCPRAVISFCNLLPSRKRPDLVAR